MEREQFAALVGRLEAQARTNPEGYRTRVVFLALLGNAYLAAMVLFIGFLFLLALGSIIFLKALGLKIAAVVGFFLWIVLKALFLKLEPPQGLEVRPGDAPALFGMIEELRAKLGAPPFHHVLVTDDFNAGVVQAPRLGIFGWPRNYLLIGLPLMKALDVEQFKAVLAHEFGHLARGHGRLSNWIYCQRLRWSRLMATLDATESKGGFLFRPFLHWYSPYFNACSFPLARANEYEADATAARLTSPQATAQALTSVNVIGSYLQERYWPDIHKLADSQPQPGFMPYVAMGRRVVQEVDEDAGRSWVEKSMAQATTLEDTHPALNERLEAIGEVPRIALPAPEAAADSLLGPCLEGITATFDERWRANILPSWEARYREMQEGRNRLAELNARAAQGAELSPQEAYDRATLTESPGGDAEAALAQLRVLLERAPNESAVHLALGARLLSREDGAGVAMLERAMALDEFSTVRCCELLRDYHWRNGRKAEADALHLKLVDRANLEQAAQRERNNLTTDDKYLKHELADEVVAGLVAQLRGVPGIAKAYLVRKRVVHFPHLPCYLFAFRAQGMFGKKKRSAELLQQVQERVQFPFQALIIPLDAEDSRFGRKFSWMRGSRIL